MAARLAAKLEPWLDRLGELRIRVFREFPYLYEGSLEHERDYLRTYMNTPQSLVVLVTRGAGELVGASTCLPLAQEETMFQEPFLREGHEISKICYFGESLLLPEFRGRGLGKEFFRLREAHARALGMTCCAFCAVNRPDHHPLRPPGYRPLDAFWKSQGFVKHPELQASLIWKEIGETEKSLKLLTYRLKQLEFEAARD